MRLAVQANFRKINEKWEGCVPWMYQDVKGLVTVGVGNLLEPVTEALKLPFRWRSDKRMATREEIDQEWRRIKAAPTLAKAGYRAAGQIAQLELSDTKIGELIQDRLLRNEESIVGRPAFYDWNKWPADAQFAIHSMAWAIGVGGVLGFPKMLMAAARMDFAGMAAECDINTVGNLGVTPRNEANRKMFLNAEKVVAGDLDRDVLRFPEGL